MIIDGKKIAKEILDELKAKAEIVKQRKPGLAFVLVGNDKASHIYVNRKKKACQNLGFHSEVIAFPENVQKSQLVDTLQSLNENEKLDGILVQMPLPHHLDPTGIIETIDPKKDVDGFHPENMGKLLLGRDDGLISCTPLGIKELLLRSKITAEKKHVVIVGRSNIVGKPLAALLVQKKPGANSTVTIVHSQTKNLEKITKEADILVAAIGKPKFITKDMVKKGSTVIDVGISRIDRTLVGDVDFEAVSPIVDNITPVPGGVGPMTIAMLMSNTWKSFSQL
jgi:methylenetetrahydrofolate dehydrogenase (NADP+) / methenyltetrahydrofolate cyclohydrolase